jgi:hypothetical protein
MEDCPLLEELREQAEARKRAKRLEEAHKKQVARWVQDDDGKFADAYCTECEAQTEDETELRTCLVNIIKAWKVKGRVGVILSHPENELWHAIEFSAAYKLAGMPCVHIHYAPSVQSREKARAFIKEGHIMLMPCKTRQIFDAVDRHIMTTARNEWTHEETGLDYLDGFITPILDGSLSPELEFSVSAFYEEYME